MPTKFSPCHNSAPATGDPTSSRIDTVNGSAPVASPQPAQAPQARERTTKSRNKSLRDKVGEAYRSLRNQPQAFRPAKLPLARRAVDYVPQNQTADRRVHS